MRGRGANYLPGCGKQATDEMRRKILSLLSVDGLTIADIARRFQISQKQVRNIRKQAAAISK